LANMQRKSEQAAQMFTELVRLMQNELNITKRDKFTKKLEVPAWL
jgi:hypothetical protein